MSFCFLQVVHSSAVQMAGRTMYCKPLAFCGDIEGALEPPKSHRYCMHRMTMGTPRKAAPQVRIQKEERSAGQVCGCTGAIHPQSQPCWSCP